MCHATHRLLVLSVAILTKHQVHQCLDSAFRTIISSKSVECGGGIRCSYHSMKNWDGNKCIQVCSGGILGLGESVDDRLKLLGELASLSPQPDSVPINALVPVEGTPLGEQDPVDVFEFIRVIATARILMPKAMVRLSAGRTAMSDEAQAMAFLAGANSIFLGDKLLTTPNPEVSDDMRLFDRLGLHPMPAKHEIAVPIHA